MAGSSLSILGDATTLPAPTAGGLTVKSVVGEIDIDTIELLGGIGGEHQSPSGSGGDGGNAGSLKLTTMMGDVQVSTVISQGGNGGMAGSTGIGGSGGAAGSATLNVQSGMLTIQDKVDTSGGMGRTGSGGSQGAGSGGAGASIQIDTMMGVNASNAKIDASGGDAGAANSGASTASAGSAGSINIDSKNAPINAMSIQADGGDSQGGSGGPGGTVSLRMMGDGNFTTITAVGGKGQSNSSGGTITLEQGRFIANGDGVPDIITGTTAGGGPRVMVFDGATGTPIRSFFAYESSFRGGVHVSSADMNNDGFADIIVGAGVGGGPRIRIFSGADGSVLTDFFGIADPNFRGGARPAVGDINNDGMAELVTAGQRTVAILDGTSLLQDSRTPLTSFQAGNVGMTLLSVAVKRANQDEFGDLIVGDGETATVYSGVNLAQGNAAPGERIPAGSFGDIFVG